MSNTNSTADAARSGELMLSSGDADICAETFGAPSDPSILLIGGAAASMDWWEDDFCTALAARGRFVIRYDNRDTGRSTSYPAGSPGYSGDDLVTDALAVLDHHGVRAAHIVGISAGGGVAQYLGVLHPQRVLTLTLMSTTPDGPAGPNTPDLPPPAARITALFAEPQPEPDWSDREASLDAAVGFERLFGGSLPVDEDHIRSVYGRMYDRTTDFGASQTNHWILEGGDESVRARLGELTTPTLVLHGTEDPLFPLPHGEALAREIPGARLVPLDGVGHQYPPPQVWDVVVGAIVEHTGSGPA